MLATTILFFLGISTIQLATASTIMFLSPILITILAIPLLGESVGLRRWSSVFVGFCGALVVVRPGVDSFEFGMIFLLIAALTNALYQINTRKVRVYDSPITSLLYTGVFGAILTSLVVPFFWAWPTLEHWCIFLFLGIAGSVSHLCLIRAFRVVPASVVAPFGYTSLVWAVGFGFIIFGELPDRWTVIGAAIIIASGLYIYHRENVIKN
jgi:drug/metabolite transporter (DMT)-like permease